eukprot:gnl/TRDRNA2_/TRDRNA2_68067_c1_seq1.p1 gnl/TRDRNA2_/TRDRNA2_68067_c1~~gnl/TRDRNA2_/TRDRNA2_68067_c1_seq1.p1  ORF type:complete len:510 (-),score=71.62 gnl/TRDRNA2_/TRDRNA2_68067_c1_seq1:120-1442(-)
MQDDQRARSPSKKSPQRGAGAGDPVRAASPSGRAASPGLLAGRVRADSPDRPASPYQPASPVSRVITPSKSLKPSPRPGTSSATSVTATGLPSEDSYASQQKSEQRPRSRERLSGLKSARSLGEAQRPRSAERTSGQRSARASSPSQAAEGAADPGMHTKSSPGIPVSTAPEISGQRPLSAGRSGMSSRAAASRYQVPMPANLEPARPSSPGARAKAAATPRGQRNAASVTTPSAGRPVRRQQPDFSMRQPHDPTRIGSPRKQQELLRSASVETSSTRASASRILTADSSSSTAAAPLNSTEVAASARAAAGPALAKARAQEGVKRDNPPLAAQPQPQPAVQSQPPPGAEAVAPPMVFVEVNIAPGRPAERLTLREGQSPEEAAATFAEKHSLPPHLANRLHVMVQDLVVKHKAMMGRRASAPDDAMMKQQLGEQRRGSV